MLTGDDYRSVSPAWRAAIDAATAAGLGDSEIDSRVNTYMARTGATGADQGWWGEQAVRRVLGLDADPAIERAQQNDIAARDAANRADTGSFLDRIIPTFGPLAVIAAPFAASAGLLGAAAAPGGSAAFDLAAENIALAEASGGTLTTTGGALTAAPAATTAATTAASMSAYDLAAENIALADASGGALETVGGALQPASGLSLGSLARTAFDLTRTALGTAGTAAQIGAAFNRASAAGLARVGAIAPGGGAGQNFNFSMPGTAIPSFDGSANSLGGQVGATPGAALPVASFTSSTPTVAIVAAMLAAIYFFARR